MAGEERELTEAIIGAAIEVHRTLGPGFLEAIYEEAMAVELSARRIEFARQLEIPVQYKGSVVGTYRLDLLVERRIVVELKAMKDIERVHYAVVRSYLRALNLDLGLLLNFAASPLDVRRVASVRVLDLGASAAP